jgi:hypothetical protein
MDERELIHTGRYRHDQNYHSLKVTMERYAAALDPEIRTFADFLMSGGVADRTVPIGEGRALFLRSIARLRMSMKDAGFGSIAQASFRTYLPSFSSTGAAGVCWTSMSMNQ